MGVNLCQATSLFMKTGKLPLGVEAEELLEHFALCATCEKESAILGVDPMMLAIDLLVEESDPPSISKKEMDTIMNRSWQIIKESSAFEEEEPASEPIKHPKANGREEGRGFWERIKEWFAPKVLIPAVAGLCLVILLGKNEKKDDPVKIYSPQNIGEEDIGNSKGRKKSAVSPIGIKLEIRSLEKGRVLLPGEILKVGDKVRFLHSFLSKSYVALYHFRDGEVTEIGEETSKLPGVVYEERQGWLFEHSGDHYFLATASKESQRQNILAALKRGGVDGLKSMEGLEFDIHRIRVSP